MNCKHCNAELAENARFCSNCGQAVNEAEQVYRSPEIQEEKKPGTGRIALAVVAIVVVLAVLVAVIVSGLGGSEDAALDATDGLDATEETVIATIPADGNPDDVTCKGSYTASDDEAIAANETVVATMGDATLTLGELQVFYWTEVVYFLQDYGSYAAYFGLDYTQPLDTQTCLLAETEMTWQQYFLACALDTWSSYQAMALEAEADGLSMSEELRAELEALPADLDESAVSYGLADGVELVQKNFGAAATMEDYVNFWELYYTGYEYYDAEYEKIQPTAEEVEAYFTENEATYTENGVTKDGGKYVDVRHILIMVEGGTTDAEGVVTYSDEEWENCRAEAQAILDEWLSGEATEDTFAALANEKSEDTGSNTVGGLYENVYEGQMVENFENWCFDETRVAGDYGLVQTNYGYHIMYFVGSNDIWFVTAETDLLNERMSALVPAAIELHPYEIDYSAIKLALVGLAG